MQRKRQLQRKLSFVPERISIYAPVFSTHNGDLDSGELICCGVHFDETAALQAVYKHYLLWLTQQYCPAGEEFDEDTSEYLEEMYGKYKLDEYELETLSLESLLNFFIKIGAELKRDFLFDLNRNLVKNESVESVEIVEDKPCKKQCL